MVLYEDCLEEINKVKLASAIENEFDPYEDPKDLQIIKNVFGLEFNDACVDHVHQELKKKPSSSINAEAYDPTPQ